jgi:hypothetical protein
MLVGSKRLVATLLAPVVATVLASFASAQVPVPEIEGPITSPGSAFIQGTTFDLASVGYVQEEFFISGSATAYANAGPLGADGLWTVTPADATAYKTRIVVIRPASKKKFSGSVFVEWLNVSGGLDASPDWTLSHVELIRSQHAWVGVSAQTVGVEGGPAVVGVVSLPLKEVNPARYGTLLHPGDSFSYDMFSQAGQAVRNGALGELKPKRVIAIGESQSAFRLVTYVNGIHPLAEIYDGFLIHSRGAVGAPLSEAPQPSIGVPGNTVIRADVDVPVLTFETETDLTFLGYAAARQDDAQNFRLWEVAGTAHADTYLLVVGWTDLGDSPAVVEPLITSAPIPGIIECGTPINAGPQHFVLKAAIAALEKWVRRGKAPKSATRLAVVAGPPAAVVTDEHGNAVGGIRTPAVDVPIAAFTGEQSGTILCRLFGTTTPFDDAKLASLYPTHDDFVKAYNRSLRRAVKARWILKPDAKLMKQWAAGASVGG